MPHIFLDDGYKDNSTLTPSALGYKYKVTVGVHRNRSIESEAKLYAANGSLVYTFTARLHGAERYPIPHWPNFDNSGAGLNEFCACKLYPYFLMRTVFHLLKVHIAKRESATLSIPSAKFLNHMIFDEIVCPFV